MINSLCPLPIGNMESMDKIPVSKGSRTDCLSMMPGAFASIGLYFLARILPFPSIGRPSASTTRPRKASPAGMLAVLPVLLTLLPARISSSSPKIIQPIKDSVRSSTIPRMPLSKTRISPYSAFSSPLICAMPSPTVITVPFSAGSASASQSVKAFLISGISSLPAYFRLSTERDSCS